MSTQSARAIVLLIPLVLVVPSLAALAPAPAALAATDFPALEWTQAGSPGGGPVQGIGGSPLVLVASTWTEGTYKSTDGGVTWAAIADFPPVSEARIAFDPADPNVGYVYGFGGVARTLDAGQTWDHALDTYVAYRLTISPSGAVFATARDAQQYTHVMRSDDRGATWTDLGRVGDSRYDSAYGLVVGSTDDVILFGSFGTLYRTTDGGQTWTSVREHQLGLERAPDGTLWRAGAELTRSTDDGATWQAVDAPAWRTPLTIRQSDGALYTNGAEGVWRTADNGATWELVGGGEATWGATSLLVDPRDDAALYTSDEFLGVLRIAPDPELGVGVVEGRTVGLPSPPLFGIGGARDGSVMLAGSTLGVYASRDGGDSWQHTGAGAGMIGVYSVAASHEGSALIGGGQNRVFQPFVTSSRDGGLTWDTQALHLGGDGAIVGIAFAGESTTRAYAAAWMELTWSSVIETTNGGLTWREIIATPGKIRDVAWDDATGTLLVATDTSVLRYHGNNVWTPQGVTMNTWTVAARDGNVWSSGPGVNVWRGDLTTPQTPWADTGAYLIDVAPEPGSDGGVWTASANGAVHRCFDVAIGEATCLDAQLPGTAEAVLVRSDGARVMAVSPAGGIWRADI